MFGGVMTIRPGPLPFLMEAGDWVEEAMDLVEGWGGPINLVRGTMDPVRRPQVMVRPGGRCFPYKSLLGAIGGDGVSGKRVLVMPHIHVEGRCGHNNRTTQPTNTNTKNKQPADNNGKPAANNNDAPAADNNKKSETVPANTTKVAPTSGINNKWQFSMDLHGCDQVKATRDSGKITVEGRGQNGDSQMMVRHVTTLPHHINPDTLTATLKDGLLTVSAAPVSVLPVTIIRGDTQAEEHSHQQTVSEGFNQQQTTNEDSNQQHTTNCQQSPTEDTDQQTATEDTDRQQTVTEDSTHQQTETGDLNQQQTATEEPNQQQKTTEDPNQQQTN